MENKWYKRYLSLAAQVSDWSYDPSTKTGAVIVNSDNRIVSVGYNGFAKGVKDLPERYKDRELKYSLIVHCEVNAILTAKRDLTGCTLFTYPFCSCARCAGVVIQAGITKCVAPPLPENLKQRWGKDVELTELQFKEAGVELVYFNS